MPSGPKPISAFANGDPPQATDDYVFERAGGTTYRIPFSSLKSAIEVSGLTAGGIVFGAADGSLAQDAGLTYNAATDTLLVGVPTNNGIDKIQVNGGIAIQAGAMDVLQIRNSFTQGVVLTTIGSDLSGGKDLRLITAAGPSAGSAGGNIVASAGVGNGAGTGGILTFTGGTGGATGSGGSLVFGGGNSGTTSGNGGSVTFGAGDSPTSGVGGTITFNAGDSNGTNQNAPDINFNVGKATGVGTWGKLLISSNPSDSRVGTVDHLVLRHLTTGTPVAGIGVGMSFVVDTGFILTGAEFTAEATDVTGGSEDFDLVFRLMTAGAAHAEKFRMKSDSTFQINATQILTTRRTGWGAPTGTATRTTFATSTVTLPQLAERVKALIDDVTTHGLIGA